VLPYAGAQAPWRLAFDFNNWGALSPQSRKDAITEAGIVKADPQILPAAVAETSKVKNPSGRLAAALLLTP
jgi:hypothetical protein